MEIKNCIKNIMQSYSLIVEFNFKRVLTKLNACRDKLKSIHWSSLETEQVTKKLSGWKVLPLVTLTNCMQKWNMTS